MKPKMFCADENCPLGLDKVPNTGGRGVVVTLPEVPVVTGHEIVEGARLPIYTLTDNVPIEVGYQTVDFAQYCDICARPAWIRKERGDQAMRDGARATVTAKTGKTL